MENFARKQEDVSDWKLVSSPEDIEYMECQLQMQQELQVRPATTSIILLPLLLPLLLLLYYYHCYYLYYFYYTIIGDMIRTGADSEVNGAYIVLGQK